MSALSAPPCGHPAATVAGLTDPGTLFAGATLPCPWPDCWAGVESARATVAVPGRGSFVMRRTRRGGSWLWTFLSFAPERYAP